MTARRKRAEASDWSNDATVARVRKARAAMWEEAGRDPRAYFDLARKEPPVRASKSARKPAARTRAAKPAAARPRRRKAA